ncbi:ceramidase-domain-containing protein [Tricladium varicosporioides]|nr:ceramidase-domain-containing protein [Hymenoscyphus varicosporioides]
MNLTLPQSGSNYSNSRSSKVRLHLLTMSFYVSSEGGYKPVWGPPTSTLNFCEVDYEFTPYVAELFNTLTNLTYIILGVRGLLSTHSTHYRQLGPKLPYLALINLGLASSLFHSTLKYPTQMCDEFSMLIATFIVFYRLLSFSQTYLSKGTLVGGLCSLMGVVVVAQRMTGESTVQQIVFTGMVYWLWHTCFKLISSLKSEDKLKKRMRWMAISGIAFFVTGHACWATDFYACGRLRQARQQIGMPWAAALELHGYWHIFTGIGVYIFMLLVECLAITGGKTIDKEDRPRVSSQGTWPFMVFLESGTAKCEVITKKDN